MVSIAVAKVVSNSIAVTVSVSMGVSMSIEGVGAPLAVVVADETVKTLGRPVAEGGGDTGVDSDAMAVGKTVSVSKTVSIAVVSIGIGISIGTPLSIGIRTGSIDGGLAAVANSGGPGSGDAAGAD